MTKHVARQRMVGKSASVIRIGRSRVSVKPREGGRGIEVARGLGEYKSREDIAHKGLNNGVGGVSKVDTAGLILAHDERKIQPIYNREIKCPEDDATREKIKGGGRQKEVQDV